ncbi:MAG TPA: GNAT family N-acetyltransferase [Phycisphaerae bacterium]|nr:GNAT family N-acetyltransferase [Phycisphaerae bacterium]HRW54537.1 GNAT family N-acetyltransferase [Phycisphaerae bacterium]
MADDAALRKCRAADLPAVLRLSAQLGYPSSADSLTARFSEIEASGADAVFVRENATGDVVGWIHISRRTLLESGPFAEIVGLVVDESARGQGVGAALVRQAEDWAAENGLTDIRLRSNVVRASAHRFYERLGYVPIKRQAVFQKKTAG